MEPSVDSNGNQLHDENGPVMVNTMAKYVPIAARTCKWTTKRGSSGATSQCSRTMIPLRLCWAMTIHKSQGMSISRPTVHWQYWCRQRLQSVSCVHSIINHAGGLVVGLQAEADQMATRKTDSQVRTCLVVILQQAPVEAHPVDGLQGAGACLLEAEHLVMWLQGAGACLLEAEHLVMCKMLVLCWMWRQHSRYSTGASLDSGLVTFLQCWLVQLWPSR